MTKPALVLVALCLWNASAVAAPQESPEELFKKLETKYAEAKAGAMIINCVIEGTSGGETRRERLDGEYLMKTGRKIRLGMWGKLNGEDHKVNLGSDGKFMAVALTGMKQIQSKKTPENLNTDMAASLTRTGFFSAIYLSMGITTGSGRDGKPADLRVMFPVSDFKNENAETLEIRSGKTLKETRKIDCSSFSFLIKPAEKKDAFQARVWYDPTTMMIIRRSLTVEMTDDKGTKTVNSVTETYENAEIFADEEKIPDAEFKLPTDK